MTLTLIEKNVRFQDKNKKIKKTSNILLHHYDIINEFSYMIALR